MEQERLHPEATGELSNLLYDLCLAAKIISRQVRRAGLTDILGESGTINVQGEVQQKLDLFANETVRHSVEHTGRVCVVASEEEQRYKPAASIFQRAIRYLGLPPANILHVGGSYPEDVVGATSLGMGAALMDRESGPRPDSGGSVRVIRSLNELPILVRESWS